MILFKMMAAITTFLLIVAPIFVSAINMQKMTDHQTLIGGKMWYTKSVLPSSALNKRNTPRNARQGTAYEDAAPSDDPKTVDLHKGEFCVDVSTYGPVEYDHEYKNVCDSTFSKQCEQRYEEVSIHL